MEVVQHYIVKISQHIPEYEADLGKMCMLLNNLHALRINIQDMFNVMGGEEVSIAASLGAGEARYIVFSCLTNDWQGGEIHCNQLPH